MNYLQITSENTMIIEGGTGKHVQSNNILGWPPVHSNHAKMVPHERNIINSNSGLFESRPVPISTPKVTPPSVLTISAARSGIY